MLDNAGQQESRSSGEGLVGFDRGTTGTPAVNNTVLLNKAKPNEKAFQPWLQIEMFGAPGQRLGCPPRSSCCKLVGQAQHTRMCTGPSPDQEDNEDDRDKNKVDEDNGNNYNNDIYNNHI